MVEIKPVNINKKKELKKFIKFEWEVYKGDRNWVPPLIIDMLSKFNPKKNPIFKHSRIQPFLAYKDGKIAGRVVATVNENYNKFQNEKVVWFGFFELINDFEVAKALLDTVAEFGKTHNMKNMRGPASFTSNDIWGMLLDNFDEPPVIMMPYNKPYYNDLVVQYGMKKIKDLYAYKLEVAGVSLPERVLRMVDYLKQRSNIKFRKLNIKDFNNEVERLRIIYNDAWEKNFGFVPWTKEEFYHEAEDLKQIVVPELALIAEVNGEPAGFTLTIPDANQAIQKINGRLLPFGIFKLLYYFKKIDHARLLTLGVRKKFRKRGIEALFYAESLKVGQKLGYKWGELSWLLEDNEPMKNGIELMGGKVYKRYRVYDIGLKV